MWWNVYPKYTTNVSLYNKMFKGLNLDELNRNTDSKEHITHAHHIFLYADGDLS